MINPHDHCNLKKISMMHNSFPEVQHDHEERKLIESIFDQTSRSLQTTKDIQGA